jgi:hypothetical protein
VRAGGKFSRWFLARLIIRTDWLLNFCWPSPAQLFLVPSPAGLMTIFYCLTSLGVVQLLYSDYSNWVNELRLTVSLSWCRAPSGAHDQLLITIWLLLFSLSMSGAPSDEEVGSIVLVTWTASVQFSKFAAGPRQHSIYLPVFISPGERVAQLYPQALKVKVTLRPTTSRSVRLGFEPRLGLMTRC